MRQTKGTKMDKLQVLYPNIRFANYKNPWRQCEINDCANIIGGGTPDTQNPRYWGGTINWFAPAELKGSVFVTQSERQITEEGMQNSGARMLPANRTVLFTSRAGIGKSAILATDACTNQGFQSLVLKDGNDPYFFYSMTDIIKNRAELIASGSTFLEISGKALGQIKINTPKEDEQRDIGFLFKNIDLLISFQQQKYNKLKILRKSFLESMFPNENTRMPFIRFKNFHETWDEKPLGELCSITTGKLDANAMVENGKYDFYTSGVAKYKIDHAAFVGPAITIAGNGATVGYMHIADGEFNAYQRTYVLQNFKKDRKYLFYEIGNKLPEKIAQEARTGNIPYIVLGMLSDLKISSAKKSEEEIKIGEFFSYLDLLIALHKQKYEKLTAVKQALLDDMFV